MVLGIGNVKAAIGRISDAFGPVPSGIERRSAIAAIAFGAGARDMFEKLPLRVEAEDLIPLAQDQIHGAIRADIDRTRPMQRRGQRRFLWRVFDTAIARKGGQNSACPIAAAHAVVLDIADIKIVAAVQHNAVRLFELGLRGRP